MNKNNKQIQISTTESSIILQSATNSTRNFDENQS